MKQYVISFFVFFLFLFSQKVSGQTYTQTFIDKCTGEVKLATTTYVNGNAVVSFYGNIRTFTPLEVQSGQLQVWLQTTYATYSSLPCPTTPTTVQQTITQTVTQTATQAATQAASAAASSAGRGSRRHRSRGCAGRGRCACRQLVRRARGQAPLPGPCALAWHGASRQSRSGCHHRKWPCA